MPILRVATRTGLVACTVLIALTTPACGPDRATPPPAPPPPVAPPNALPAPPDLDAPVEAGPAEAARPAEAKVVPTSLQVEDLEKVRRGVGWRPVAAVDNPDGDYACQRRALDSFGTVGGTSVAAEGQVDELTTFDVSQKIGIFPDELNAGAAVKGLAADIENCGTQVGDVVVTQVGS